MRALIATYCERSFFILLAIQRSPVEEVVSPDESSARRWWEKDAQHPALSGLRWRISGGMIEVGW
jgi:hypothetical protein